MRVLAKNVGNAIFLVGVMALILGFVVAFADDYSGAKWGALVTGVGAALSCAVSGCVLHLLASIDGRLEASSASFEPARQLRKQTEDRPFKPSARDLPENEPDDIELKRALLERGHIRG